MRNDPDGEYSLLMFSIMIIGTIVIWIALIGAYATLPLWDPNPSTSRSAWLLWSLIFSTAWVEMLGLFFMTWPLSRGERVGLILIMLLASVPACHLFLE